MSETPHFSDLTGSLLPRSLEPKLPKPEGAPESAGDEASKLTAVDQPGPLFSPASSENRENPLLEIVEQGMDAGEDSIARKVPNDERSKVGTIVPPIT